MSRTTFPRLREGEHIRLRADGPDYRVTRVSEGAAYLKPRFAVPKSVTVPARHGHPERTFLAHEGGKVITISPTAAVYREPFEVAARTDIQEDES